MELAVSALAALGTGAAATAGTAAAIVPIGTTLASASAGAVTAGAGFAATASSVLGTLSTVATVGSMVATLFGGYAADQQGRDQAAMAELNADGAQLDAREKALRIRREMVQQIGKARVAFAGSGLDISSGQAIEGGYRAEADFETTLARTGGEIGAVSARMQASNYRSRGSASLVEAAGKIAGQVASQSTSIARRG